MCLGSDFDPGRGPHVTPKIASDGGGCRFSLQPHPTGRFEANFLECVFLSFAAYFPGFATAKTAHSGDRTIDYASEFGATSDCAAFL